MFQNKLGDTVLHAAAWKGYSDIVEMLLTKSEYPATSLIWFYKKKLAGWISEQSRKSTERKHHKTNPNMRVCASRLRKQ